MTSPGVVATYGELVGVPGDVDAVTLNEGATPLVVAPTLAELTGCDVRLKVEGANPTGSFKDRGMTVAITRAVAEGATAVICASTGNTSASAAAYSARAGLACAVVVPEGRVAIGKLAQAIVHGAQVVQVRGSFDDALRCVRALGERGGVTVVNSVNHDRILGQASAAYELVDELGRAPDAVFLPVGNAGNITAYGLGFRTYRDHGRSATLPPLRGYQAEGAAPIVLGRVVEHPETVASAIRIGNPASWQPAVAATNESGGRIDAVSDAAILEAWRLLAEREGVFCEPASAAGVAGLLRDGAPSGSLVVCVLTGAGLKDPDTATASAPPPTVLEADVDALAEAVLSPPAPRARRGGR